MLLIAPDRDTLLDALRRGRVALTTRVVQLSRCRTCGAEVRESEAAVEVLKDLERQLLSSEDLDVQVR